MSENNADKKTGKIFITQREYIFLRKFFKT